MQDPPGADRAQNLNDLSATEGWGSPIKDGANAEGEDEYLTLEILSPMGAKTCHIIDNLKPDEQFENEGHITQRDGGAAPVTVVKAETAEVTTMTESASAVQP